MHEQQVNEGTQFDGLANFLMYKAKSAETKARTIFPTGERRTIINPNAKPLKLDPPK